MFYKQTVSTTLFTILKELMDFESLLEFQLVGGTSLALQLGHRSSIDIDLFSYNHFDKPAILNELIENYRTNPTFKILSEAKNGITFIIENIKVDIYDWKTPFIRQCIDIEGIRMASIEDICGFKLNAILNRSTLKDYFDLAVISEKFEINQMLSCYKEKYPFFDVGLVIKQILDKNELEIEDFITFGIYSNLRDANILIALLKAKINEYNAALLKTKNDKLEKLDKKRWEILNKKKKK